MANGWVQRSITKVAVCAIWCDGSAIFCSSETGCGPCALVRSGAVQYSDRVGDGEKVLL